jgi:hypothetical protein
MRKLMFVIVAAAGTCLLLSPPLSGCGDKFVVLGRGLRFQAVHMSAHPASILIYMNPNSHVPAAEKELQLQATLRLAGHKPHAVEASSDLDKALSSGSYDLVLADLSDVATLEPEVHAAASKPEIVPILYNPTPTELEAAKKQYSCLFKADKKSHELLTVIDEAVQSRLKGATCQNRR